MDGEQPTAPLAVPVAAPSHIQRVAVKIPPLWKDNVAAWFVQVESQFFCSGITADDTKFHTVVAALDGDVIQHMMQLLKNPPPDNKYGALKESLLKNFDSSEQSKLRKLFSGMELGDKKPSHLLNEMQNLGGTVTSEELLYTLWIDMLPANVVPVIESLKGSLNDKAAVADKITAAVGHKFVSQTSSGPCSHPPSEEINEIKLAIQELTRKFGELNRGRQRSRSRRSQSVRRSKSRSESKELCYFHRRFGSYARNCRPHCAFESTDGNPKN